MSLSLLYCALNALAKGQAEISEVTNQKAIQLLKGYYVSSKDLSVGGMQCATSSHMHYVLHLVEPM